MTNSTETSIGLELKSLGHEFTVGNPILSNINAKIKPGSHVLINGANGSGKSTLGKIIAGQLTPTEGTISWRTGPSSLDNENILLNASFTGPSTTLHPQMSILEILHFHGTFRKWRQGVNPETILKVSGLSKHMNVRFIELSSGMQQRVLLAVSLATESGLVVLDEPCANLDASGIEWYQHQLSSFPNHSTLIVCSNDRREDYKRSDLTISL